MFRHTFTITILCSLICVAGLFAQNPSPAIQATLPLPPMTWEMALAEAAQNHPDLIVAKESVVQAKANVQEAQGAQLPEVDANASVGRTKLPGLTTNQSSIGLSAAFTVFDGGLKRAETNLAKAQLAGTRQSYRVTSALLRFNLRSAYLNLWQAQQNIAISQSIVKLRQDSYDLIHLHYLSGTEHMGSLKLASAKLDQAKADAEAAQRDLGSIQTALCQAMGEPVAQPVSVVSDEPALPVIPEYPALSALFDILTKGHPSYLQSLASEKVARQGLKTAQANNWPTIVLSADAGRTSNDIPPKETQGGAALTASYTLFNGFAREAGVEKARSAFRAAQAATQSNYNSIFTNLKSTWNTLLDSLNNAKVQASFLDANAEREKIARAQYSVGTITYNDWTIIEDNLVSSEGANLSAKTAALKAEAAWRQAQGVVLDE